MMVRFVLACVSVVVVAFVAAIVVVWKCAGMLLAVSV